MKLVVDNAAKVPASDQRRGMLAKVHVARKALGIAEDDYRALLSRVTGHDSAGDCDQRQLTKLIGEFERMGFRASTSPTRRAHPQGSVARKARAMWISLYQLGAIGEPSDAALDAFAKRQLGVDRLAWMNEREGFKLIEALKKMAERHGWDQQVPARMATADRIRLLKDRLVGAQLARLAEAGVSVAGPLAADRGEWSSKQLESAAGELAAMLRTAPS